MSSDCKSIVFLFLLCLHSCLQSCTSPVGEARQTLAAADSVRVNEGRLYDDSLALAEAFATTGKWRYIYPNDYARACYYYGYLLRQHGDQVAAMQAFIAGTHAPYIQRVIPLPWFSNYHILGRIYSNMGTMCHLVDEFQLGYDMYEQSAKSFYRAGDTTLYYYGLNAMALELAEQKLHDETLALLDSIEQNCTDNGVLTKLWETKAILYFNLEQYDSTIHCANQLYSHGYQMPTGYVKTAQAFWCLQKLDSALHYARVVMEHPYASMQDQYHVIYIIMKHDSTIDVPSIQSLSSERADIDANYIEPLLVQLSAASEYLRQDYSRMPYVFNLLLLLASIGLVVAIAWGLIIRIRHQHKRSSNALESQRIELQNDISVQRQILYAETKREKRKQHQLQQQQLQLQKDHLDVIEQNSQIIRGSNNIREALSWTDYEKMCRYVNDAFFMFVTKLTAKGNFNEFEVRLCVLVLLELDYETMSKLLHHAQNGLGKAKYRIAQKLGTTTKNLHNYLVDLAINAHTN